MLANCMRLSGKSRNETRRREWCELRFRGCGGRTRMEVGICSGFRYFSGVRAERWNKLESQLHIHSARLHIQPHMMLLAYVWTERVRDLTLLSGQIVCGPIDWIDMNCMPWTCLIAFIPWSFLTSFSMDEWHVIEFDYMKVTRTIARIIGPDIHRTLWICPSTCLFWISSSNVDSIGMQVYDNSDKCTKNWLKKRT